MTVSRKIRVGILGSGKGSNMEAIARATAESDCPYEVALVLSDVEQAGILEKARVRQIPTRFIPPGKYRTKLDEDAERHFLSALRDAGAEWVVLAGFMRILKGEFLRVYENRVVNIHPSLLPAFPGLEAWKQALDYGVKVTGCTVHLVDQGIDTGAILGQATTPILDEDTPESLHARIQDLEKALYPEILKALAQGQVRVQGRRSFRLAS